MLLSAAVIAASVGSSASSQAGSLAAERAPRSVRAATEQLASARRGFGDEWRSIAVTASGEMNDLAGEKRRRHGEVGGEPTHAGSSQAGGAALLPGGLVEAAQVQDQGRVQCSEACQGNKTKVRETSDAVLALVDGGDLGTIKTALQNFHASAGHTAWGTELEKTFCDRMPQLHTCHALVHFLTPPSGDPSGHPLGLFKLLGEEQPDLQDLRALAEAAFPHALKAVQECIRGKADEMESHFLNPDFKKLRAFGEKVRRDAASEYTGALNQFLDDWHRWDKKDPDAQAQEEEPDWITDFKYLKELKIMRQEDVNAGIPFLMSQWNPDDEDYFEHWAQLDHQRPPYGWDRQIGTTTIKCDGDEYQFVQGRQDDFRVEWQ